MSQCRPTAIILYHFFYPDDVISAQHFSQFTEELVKRGWDITVLTSNRYCRYPKKKINKRREIWQGIRIIRIKRPALNQANKCFRLINSVWMMTGWGIKLCQLPRADAIIIGTDPPFSALLFPLLRFLKRGKILVHWCYDVYPDAIIANGVNSLLKWSIKKLNFLMRWCYNSVDLIVDIGACMRRRLNEYKHNANYATLVPWALVESDQIEKPDAITRSQLFGDTKLALLYSGNMGKAHDYSLFLELASKLYKENPDITFCFACRGNRAEELTKTIRPVDCNIHFAPFVKESELKKRLDSADIHLLSLRSEWDGIVVPSKFFGSLSVGRPVLYAGPESSAIAGWIQDFNVGLVLTENNMEDVVAELLDLAQYPDRLHEWQQNAYHAYRHFSKKHTMDQWDRLLRDSINNCKVILPQASHPAYFSSADR
jgi:glycosyltransferase involved in cell wall biosynthesis